ncbi:MAG: arginine-tRNA-protein transferase [Acidobacteria bacterium]|nr:arginine-tRNA-protein transferase [Acidobacteriota bacterium]
MSFINEYFMRAKVTPEQMDFLWASGWRHFGTYFFRYSSSGHWGGVRTVMPLRIELARFISSRSQKRVTARNSALRIVVRDTFIDADKENLFYRHRQRFKENIPDSIYEFLSEEPAVKPCSNREICVYDGDRMVAASFLDIGGSATSAVYAMFEPSESKRSLGIFTMLEAIRYSRELGCKYYYPGYAYREPSVYDYKKNFAGSEYYDWKEGWKPFTGRETAERMESFRRDLLTDN